MLQPLGLQWNALGAGEEEKGRTEHLFFSLLSSYEDSHILILLPPGSVKLLSRASKDKVSEVLPRTESLPFCLLADLLQVTYLP